MLRWKEESNARNENGQSSRTLKCKENTKGLERRPRCKEEGGKGAVKDYGKEGSV